MSDDKLISFILTVYNKEPFINQCLKSLNELNKFKEIKNKFEIIAINDCSSDGSLKKLKFWETKIPNLKLINNNKNMGVSKSRNIGIIKSKSKYLFFIDSDDFIISKNFKEIISNKKIFKDDLLIFYNTILTNKSLVTPKIKRTRSKSIFNSIVDITNSTRFNVWKFLFCKEFLLKKKIFFKEDLYQNEDWVFIAETVSKNPKYNLIKKHLYCYNHNLNESLTTKILKKNFLNSIKTYYYLKRISSNIYSKKLIDLMVKEIIEILLSDAFLLKKKEINKYQKKYSFLGKIFKRNIIYRNQISRRGKKILIFCAGRFGRTLTRFLPKKQIGKKIVIDQNIGLYNKKYNKFIVKDFTFFLKNKKIFNNYDFAICNLDSEISKLIKKKIITSKINNNRIINFE